MASRSPIGATKETNEHLTDRKVIAFRSQMHVDPEITIEVFFVDGPLEAPARSR